MPDSYSMPPRGTTLGDTNGSPSSEPGTMIPIGFVVKSADTSELKALSDAIRQSGQESAAAFAKALMTIEARMVAEQKSAEARLSAQNMATLAVIQALVEAIKGQKQLPITMPTPVIENIINVPRAMSEHQKINRGRDKLIESTDTRIEYED